MHSKRFFFNIDFYTSTHTIHRYTNEIYLGLTIKEKPEYVKYLTWDNSRLWNVKTVHIDTSHTSDRLCSFAWFFSSFWDKQYPSIRNKIFITRLAGEKQQKDFCLWQTGKRSSNSSTRKYISLEHNPIVPKLIVEIRAINCTCYSFNSYTSIVVSYWDYSFYALISLIFLAVRQLLN